MICPDTNCWIAYVHGEKGPDVGLLIANLEIGRVRMAAPVVAELVSDPNFPPEAEIELLDVGTLAVDETTWYRAGKLRAKLISRGYKPKLIDTLIAQVCIDNDVSLLTRDRDFSMFKKHAGLKLA
ncbi:MAG: PIN domain-containing protein [Bryobacteraceae bacterium]|nr:PIN domain-containing protein [Bryobacteraceae bacterium]